VRGLGWGGEVFGDDAWVFFGFGLGALGWWFFSIWIFRLNRYLIDFFLMVLFIVVKSRKFLCWYSISGLCWVMVRSLMFFCR